MYVRSLAVALVAVCLLPVSTRAEPVKVNLMRCLEGTIDSIGALDGGVRLIVPVRLKNTCNDYIAIALVPPFPKASSSDGTTYFMQEVAGVTRCRNNNPIMGPACMGKPFTQGITIEPSAYTVIEPGAAPSINFQMARERGEGGGTYATFSALFAVRTFSNLDEDAAKTDNENYKRGRSVNAGFPEVRVVPQSSK